MTMVIGMGLYAPDAVGYDKYAWQLATGGAPTMSSGKEGFPVLLAGIYLAAGHLPILGIILNVTLSTALIVVVAASAIRLNGNPRIVAWGTALFPPLLLWGGLLLRESLTWILLATTVWVLTRLIHRITDWPAWAIGALSLIALLWVRGSAALIVGGAAAIALVFVRKRQKIVTITTTAVVGILAALVLTGVVKLVGGVGLSGLAASRAELAKEASAGSFPTVSFANPGDSLWAFVQLLPRVLFGPFPWEWPAVGLAFAFDALVWCALLWMVWRGWKNSSNRRRLLVAFLPAAAIVLALTVSSGNYGTMQRLRVQAAVLILPIAAFTRRSPDSEPDLRDDYAAAVH
ncbi:MAG: hypothetical protein JWM49_3010 [Microbacteriaceae bacterium]|nr:hypothetical protein [Microbacteriaceae bacterium]